MVVVIRPASFPGGRRVGRRLLHGDIAIVALSQLIGFGRDLRDVEYQVLLSVGARYGHSRLHGRIERSENFLRPVLVVERCTVDGGDEIASAQTHPREGLAIGAWIDAKSLHLAAGE